MDTVPIAASEAIASPPHDGSGVELERAAQPKPAALAPYPGPEWRFGDSCPFPDTWSSNGCELATLRTHVPGTHVMCVYTVQLIRIAAPLPRCQGRAIVPKLPLLEAGRRRPTKNDESVGAYLDRVEAVRRPLVIDNPIPSRPSKEVYVTAGWVAFDYVREIKCAACGKDLKMLNGRTTRTMDNFRFRPCCFPAAEFKSLKPHALTDITDMFNFFYDLETTPDLDGVHHLYMGMVKIPEQLHEQIGGEIMRRINSADELLDLIDLAISATYEMLTTNPEKNISIQIISFNGSRYDDLFLVQAWRERIYNRLGRKALQSVEFSERKGALTFNTFRCHARCEVRWTDLARFVPPTSLKNLAKSFKLSEEKGSMPFEALNDFVQRGHAAVTRDEDGFLSLHKYYKGDYEERARSLAYYQEVVPEEFRTPTRDLDKMCEEYCAQDVRVTEAAYHKLNGMYSEYLAEQALISPHQPKNPMAPTSFSPMTMHSMATMAGRILLASASGSTVWGYDTMDDSEAQICPSTSGGWELMAPVGATYDYCRLALAGGWVKGYFQGLVLDPDQVPADMAKAIAQLEERHNVPTLKLAHDMTDIASMYPVGVTYPMPLGRGDWVPEARLRAALIEKVLACDDPLKIPKFLFRAKWKAPRRPLYSESTLPQRKERSNILRWTYWDDPSATRVVTSLDLWIAGRDHTGAGPDTIWKCYDCVDMLYWPRSGQVYRPFMTACTKLKMDGAAEGNELKRTAGKIAMNSGIGKLGQQVEAQTNVLGKRLAYEKIKNGGDRVRLIAAVPVLLRGKNSRPDLDETEYIFSEKEAEKNRWPMHHAAFMYAATRLMRLNWNLLARPQELRHVLLNELPHPDTLYGDTDSKLLPTSYSRNLPEEFIGDTVGQFRPEEEPSLLTRPVFQVEPEKVSAHGTISTVSGILGSKKYFVWGLNPTTGKRVLKFKCNGLTRWSVEKHPCPLHGVMRCARCRCSHDDFQFECLQCVVGLLAVEEREEGDASDWQAVGRDYKYSVFKLRALTLLDFVRVLVTGFSCATVIDTFDRVLSRPTSKLPPFTVKTTAQSRSLNRPVLLRTAQEIVCDLPAASRLLPFARGCAQVSQTNSGILYPSGSYLMNCWSTLAEDGA